MFLRFIFLFLLGTASYNLLSQNKLQPPATDTLIIKFPRMLLNDKVMINKLDIYGDNIKTKETNRLTFLFISSNLKNKLNEKRKRDSIRYENNRIIVKPFYRGLSGQLGIEFNYYQLDSIATKGYNALKWQYDKTIHTILENGGTQDQVIKYVNSAHKSLFPPLKQLYVEDNFLKGKDFFNFDGTVNNYLQLKKKLEGRFVIFILMPFDTSDLYGYKNHLVQVKERYDGIHL